jgi:protein-disulfide isomerase
MAPSFAVTFDYRCPFARIAHEHLLDGLEAGADWDVRFVPFSLSAAKEPTWDRTQDSGLLALELAVAVRDTQPDRFLAAHRALFEVRHGRAQSLRDADVLRDALGEAGVDVDAAFDEVDGGVPLKTVRTDHERAATEHDVWGVPVFIVGDQAVFVRLMDRPATSDVPPTETIERIVTMAGGWPSLNEFKHTSLPR